MASPLRVCLYNQASSTDDSSRESFFGHPDTGDQPFGAPFRPLPELEIVAECATWQQLQECLLARSIGAVIVNLDACPDENGRSVIQHIAEIAPECGIIGVSRDAQPDTIIGVMRAGCSQFVRWPVDPVDLSSAIHSVRQKFQPLVQGCHRVCVIGSSGGTGATTVACNLAMELVHVSERRCALVDMNLQFGDVACSFDVTPRYTVADVCHSGSEIDRTLLESALEVLPCGVSILARPEKMDVAHEVTADGVEQMFRVLAQMFPFVVVDLPRHFNPPAVAALSGTDRVLIVSQLTVPNLRNATRIYQHLVELGANEDHIHLVLNRGNASFDRIKPEEVRKHFGRPIFATIPNDYKRIGASRDLGHPIMSDAPNSPARLAIQEMAKRLVVEHLGEDALCDTGRGLLGLFRKKRSKVLQTT